MSQPELLRLAATNYKEPQRIFDPHMNFSRLAASAAAADVDASEEDVEAWQAKAEQFQSKVDDKLARDAESVSECEKSYNVSTAVVRAVFNRIKRLTEVSNQINEEVFSLIADRNRIMRDEDRDETTPEEAGQDLLLAAMKTGRQKRQRAEAFQAISNAVEAAWLVFVRPDGTMRVTDKRELCAAACLFPDFLTCTPSLGNFRSVPLERGCDERVELNTVRLFVVLKLGQDVTVRELPADQLATEEGRSICYAFKKTLLGGDDDDELEGVMLAFQSADETWLVYRTLPIDRRRNEIMKMTVRPPDHTSVAAVVRNNLEPEE